MPDFFTKAQNIRIQNSLFHVIETTQNQGPSGIQILHQNIAQGAMHDSAERNPPPRCHPGTRKDVVDKILHWIAQPSDRCANDTGIFWLNGPMGVGKTSIAQTLCEILQEHGDHTRGNFFFSRTAPGRNTAQALISTLAYQLAITHDSIRATIEKTIEIDPSIVNKAIKVQLQKLIVEPLQALQPGDEKSVLLVIDGLDECQGETAQKEVIQVLGSIFQGSRLPIKVVLTSRPEPGIRDEFLALNILSNVRQNFLERTLQTDEDIQKYFYDGFYAIHHSPDHRLSMANVTGPWPHWKIIEELVRRASGQFIHASTVLKFIGDPDYRPVDRLDAIIKVSEKLSDTESITLNHLAELDQLYIQILSSSKNIEQTISVLGCIIAWSEVASMTSTTLHVNDQRLYQLQFAEWILGLQSGEARLALRSTQSLIEVPPPENIDYRKDEIGITFYHESFKDFLIDPRRSGDHSLDMNQVHGKISLMCLGVMRKAPEILFNDTQSHYAYLLWDSHWLLSAASGESFRWNLVKETNKTYRWDVGHHVAKEMGHSLKKFVAKRPRQFSYAWQDHSDLVFRPGNCLTSIEESIQTRRPCKISHHISVATRALAGTYHIFPGTEFWFIPSRNRLDKNTECILTNLTKAEFDLFQVPPAPTSVIPPWRAHFGTSSIIDSVQYDYSSYRNFGREPKIFRTGA